MLGQMIVLDRAVAASGAFEANDIAPVVVQRDVRCRKGREYHQRLAAILAFSSLDDSAAENPFRVADAAVETPTAADPISALLAHSAAGRKEGNGGGWDMAVGEDAIEPGFRQESAQRPDRRGAD